MFPFKFELSGEGLEVKLGSWVLRRIYYHDIAGVEPGSTFWNEHWCNFGPFEFVTVRRKSGLIKNFIINPPAREKFINDLRFRIGGK